MVHCTSSLLTRTTAFGSAFCYCISDQTWLVDPIEAVLTIFRLCNEDGARGIFAAAGVRASALQWSQRLPIGDPGGPHCAPRPSPQARVGARTPGALQWNPI